MLQQRIFSAVTTMRKTIILSFFLLLSTVSSAQTQHGYVKTKGRMVNGQHVAGKGLPGATVSIQGGNSVGVKNSNGSFSFVVPAKTYMVQSVQKKGYELVDADAVRKPYQQSANPLYFVMETPEQQMEDLLEAQEQISKTLREQLKKSRQKIQRLKEENKITEEDYRRRLAKLMEDQQNRQKLIADMAKEYSQMDYDQMDSLNQRISDAILNGRLMEADSLLRSKGDMKSRIAEVRKEQQAEAREEQELAQRQENLEASKEGTKKKLEDIASDCYKFFDRFKLENQHDSAAYYIEMRAELDTTNAESQFKAGYYFYEQKQYHKARPYYKRALTVYRILAENSPMDYKPYMAKTLSNLALLFSQTRQFKESENMYKEALFVYRQLAEKDSLSYASNIASTMSKIAVLYYKIKRFSDSEAMYKEALSIYQRLADSIPQKYDSDMASTLNGLGNLYYSTNRFLESETMHKSALKIHRLLAIANPQVYEIELAMSLSNLGLLYYDSIPYTLCESMYKESLDICRRLTKSNPQAYEPDVARLLYNLASLYQDNNRLSESEAMYKEGISIRRRLAILNPMAYELSLATMLNGLALLYTNTHRFTESDTLYKEALELRRKHASINPIYLSDVVQTLGNLSINCILASQYSNAEMYAREGLSMDSTQSWIVSYLAVSILFQGKYSESEELYRQYKDKQKDLFLDDFRQLSETGAIPKEREADVERIKKMLNE